VWKDAWKTRTPEQWGELARKYRFRLVIAPAEFEVDLPMLLQTSQANLYEIPRGVDPDRD
jgi:hypothetical protein